MKIPFKGQWDLLMRYLKPLWPRVLLLALLLFTGIGLQLVNPQILRHFVDSVRSGASLDTLTRAALLFIGVALANQVVTVFSTYVSEMVGWRATNALRSDLALHCLKLDMSFHNERTPGELIERIDGDVASLANFFSQFVVRILGNFFLLMGVLVVLFRENWGVGVAMTIYAGITLTGLLAFRNVAVPYWVEARQATSDLFGFLEERLGGTVDIRSNGGTPYAMRLLYHFARSRLGKELRASVINIRLNFLNTGLYSVGQIMAVVLGYYLFRADAITLGTIFLIIYYTDTLFRPLEQITHQIEDLQQASAGVSRIGELYRTKSKIEDGPSGAQFSPGALSVDFQGVSFA